MGLGAVNNFLKKFRILYLNHATSITNSDGQATAHRHSSPVTGRDPVLQWGCRATAPIQDRQGRAQALGLSLYKGSVHPLDLRFVSSPR